MSVLLCVQILMPHLLPVRAMQSVCAEAASFDLPADVLGACISEMQAAVEVALVRGQDHQAAAVFAERAHPSSACLLLTACHSMAQGPGSPAAAQSMHC